EHSVIADDGRLTGPRRIDGPVSDSFLKGAKRFELCKSAACILMVVGHEVNEGSVGQPQSHVMNALRMARVQFLEHAPDQLLVFICALRFGLVTDQGSFHFSLLIMDGFESIPLVHSTFNRRSIDVQSTFIRRSFDDQPTFSRRFFRRSGWPRFPSFHWP